MTAQKVIVTFNAVFADARDPWLQSSQPIDKSKFPAMREGGESGLERIGHHAVTVKMVKKVKK